MIGADTELEDVAYAVCTALEQAGTIAVLTGGSAATVHSRGLYRSKDIDFVMTMDQGAGGATEVVLSGLGYQRGAFEFRHAVNPLRLDFPAGPLAVGDEYLRSWETRRRPGEVLFLLTAEDSVKDRLAAFLHWQDYRGLEQARAVYRGAGAAVDLSRIEDWVWREGGESRWSMIRAQLA